MKYLKSAPFSVPVGGNALTDTEYLIAVGVLCPKHKKPFAKCKCKVSGKR